MKKQTAEVQALVRFATIGAVGFIVDGGLLAIAVYGLGGDARLSRLVSFPIAVVVTWLFNRLWTFETRQGVKASTEFARYLGSQGLGCLVNFAFYGASLTWLPYPFNAPLVALALAAGVALAANYMLVRVFVFDVRSVRAGRFHE